MPEISLGSVNKVVEAMQEINPKIEINAEGDLVKVAKDGKAGKIKKAEGL